jgi:hypothetical protein
MAIDYTALGDELIKDPLGLGYLAAEKGSGGDDSAVAALINAIQPSIVIQRADISPQELFEAIFIEDINKTADAGQLAYLSALANLPAIRLTFDDGSQTFFLKGLTLVIGDSNGSMTRLFALAQRLGSRAEQLFGTGTVITHQDVAKALRG